MSLSTASSSRTPEPAEPTHWVSLGRACRMLGVNESTLRRWADDGQVRSYRTPGGHRRFSEGDLIALMNGSQRRPHDTYGGLGDIALARIRRHLHRGKTTEEPWYRNSGEGEGRERLRALGRRLVDLVPDYLSRRGRHTRAQTEARVIGAGYGEELRSMGLSSRDAVQAFTFFRRELVDAAKQFAIKEGLANEGAEEAREQIVALADEVLLALLESYETSDAPTAAPIT